MTKPEPKAKEVITEEDGSKVYVYHYATQLKRKDKDGNREVGHYTITRRYNPKHVRSERIAKFHSLIKSLYDANPDMKPGQLYKLYSEKCTEEGISEDFQYTLGYFYIVLKRIKKSPHEDN